MTDGWGIINTSWCFMVLYTGFTPLIGGTWLQSTPPPTRGSLVPARVVQWNQWVTLRLKHPSLTPKKNISISKKKINWSNNYSLWHLHLNITFSLTTILQQIKETSCEGREVNQVIKRERERCIINNNNTNFTRKIKSSLFVTECRSRYSWWRVSSTKPIKPAWWGTFLRSDPQTPQSTKKSSKHYGQDSKHCSLNSTCTTAVDPSRTASFLPMGAPPFHGMKLLRMWKKIQKNLKKYKNS